MHLGKKRKEKNKITQPQEPDHRTHSRYQHSGHSRTSIPGRPSDRQALRQAGPQTGWPSGRLVSTGQAAVDPCNWPATHDFPCLIKLRMPLSFIEALLPPFLLFHPLPSPPSICSSFLKFFSNPLPPPHPLPSPTLSFPPLSSLLPSSSVGLQSSVANTASTSQRYFHHILDRPFHH